MSRRLLVVLLALAALWAAGGCGAAGAGQEQPTLTVLAASSLTETFEELGDTFEQEHPGVTVRFSFDSSATLAEQVAQGAPGDVLATADTRTMQTVVEAGSADGVPREFATNRLVLVVPRANPAGVRRFADLGDPRVDFVMCVESAPCGALARAALDAARLTAAPRSAEVDVKSVLTKVVLGEADAGLVYASDAHSAGNRVRALPVPGPASLANHYPVTVLAGSEHRRLARQWVDLVLSERGRDVLGHAGFGSP